MLHAVGLGWLMALALAVSGCAVASRADNDHDAGPDVLIAGADAGSSADAAGPGPASPGSDAGVPPDWAPKDPLRCTDEDFDGCDDCSSGAADPRADGPDADGDGRCDRPTSFQPAPTMVAVAEAGALGYSTDNGATWLASPDSGTWSNLRSAAAGLGTFFVVGAGERMLRSNDGITWSEVLDVYPSGVMELEVVTYAGAGEWAAGGADAAGSRVIVSYDHGLTWEDAGSPFGAGAAVTGLAVHRDTGRWVAVGSPGDRIAYASRAVSARIGPWTEVAAIAGSGPAPGAGFAAAAYHRGGWTAVGSDGVVASSTDDGETWTYLEPLCDGQSLSAIVAGAMQVVAVGDGGCVTESGTGANREWMQTRASPSLAESALRSAFFDLGSDVVFAGNARGEIGVSHDGGATWTRVATEAVFSSADAIVGIAGEAVGAVRAEVLIGSTGNACPPALAGAPRLDTYVPDMNIPSNGDNQPRILGIGPMKNGSVQLRAGLRVTNAGEYALRVRIGPGDTVEALVDGQTVVGCGGGSAAPVALDPAVTADLVVRWVDDGYRDAIVVEYRGPDTGDAWAVIPASAFVRTH